MSVDVNSKIALFEKTILSRKLGSASILHHELTKFSIIIKITIVQLLHKINFDEVCSKILYTDIRLLLSHVTEFTNGKVKCLIKNYASSNAFFRLVADTSLPENVQFFYVSNFFKLLYHLFNSRHFF